jgi:hypothetical protein
MRKFSFYKHVNSTDMVILVLRAVKVPRGARVKVNYHILSAVDRSPIDTQEKEEILITTEQLPNWKHYEWKRVAS